MVRIMRAEKLRTCLSGLCDVVDLYAAGQVEFAPLTLRWLSAAETVLREERLPQATQVLTARTAVIAARDRSQAAGKSGAARRRDEALAAIDAISLTETLLRERLLTVEDEIDAYEDKLVEAVTGLVVLGHLPPMEGVGRNRWAQQVWAALASLDETRPTAVWLSAALAAPDRLFLLDRILQRLGSSQLPVLTLARARPDLMDAPE